jgi:hypothetical protein
MIVCPYVAVVSDFHVLLLMVSYMTMALPWGEPPCASSHFTTTVVRLYLSQSCTSQRDKPM